MTLLLSPEKLSQGIRVEQLQINKQMQYLVPF